MMLRTIFLDPAITKRLELLQRSGKKASMAADKADEIISRLRNGESMPVEIGPITKHGELRIRGCIKYDLGSGYRLVTVKQDDRIYVLYVGSHDDCHRWIENNRELTEDQIQHRCTKIDIDLKLREKTAKTLPEQQWEEDPDPLSQVSEKDLRFIFRGLINEGVVV